MQKGLLAILLCWVLVLLLPQHSFAETEFYDFSQNLSDYSQAVAFLNQPKPVHNGLPEEEHIESCLSALLCRTDGSDVNFEGASALYVLAGPNHCYTLFFAEDKERDAAVELLNRTEGILYAEADCEVTACAESDDMVCSFQSWGAEEMCFSSYLNYIKTCDPGSVMVAVIDSGCFPHPLMLDRIVYGGFDYIDGDCDASNDLFGHGTNVAGILADCTLGTSVLIYPIRVLGSGGTGKMSNVVNAVREAVGKASIINLSLESFTLSQSLDDAVREAVSAGVVVVAAAGNSACDTSQVCPAHLTDSGVIVVGSAEGSSGAWQRAYYSNYGASVDVYAFGSNIRCCSRSGGYTVESGTSMAAPHISAVCALMRLLHPELSPSEIEHRLRAAAEDENLPIPYLLQMIPQAVSFSLSDVRLWAGAGLTLPPVLPESSCEELMLTSSDETVILCEGRILTALTPGTADITVSCSGLEDTVFHVTVTEEQPAQLCMPNTVVTVEEEAFYGDSSIVSVALTDMVQSIGSRAFDECLTLSMIAIPPSVTEIGENTFSGAVILCRSGSAIHAYAQEQQLQYITSSDLFDE